MSEADTFKNMGLGSVRAFAFLAPLALVLALLFASLQFIVQTAYRVIGVKM